MLYRFSVIFGSGKLSVAVEKLLQLFLELFSCLLLIVQLTGCLRQLMNALCKGMYTATDLN